MNQSCRKYLSGHTAQVIDDTKERYRYKYYGDLQRLFPIQMNRDAWESWLTGTQMSIQIEDRSVERCCGGLNLESQAETEFCLEGGMVRARHGDESLTSLAVYFRNWHMFREDMNNIPC